MNILIVNDDSIHAPGIRLLAWAASQLGDVYVVAPASQCSAMSQKLTLREDMTLRKLTDFPADVKAAWEVGGTPVDCVKVALYHILKEKPDLVLSGINNGYNAGFDIAYSGTLGAAFEAARNGVSAIAFSAPSDAHLPAVEPWLLPVLKELAEADAGVGNVWNVNFPRMNEQPPKGILRDRIPAYSSLFHEDYRETVQPDGTVTLSCRGIPVPDEALCPGSDGEAVRAGYISIGKVRAF